MFSATLERRRRINRWALVVAATLLATGIALIVVWTVRAYDMLGFAGASRMPIVYSVLAAIAGLLILCLLAYAAIRAYGRFTEAR
jgi:uncharacterized integral membrane protein